MRRLLFFILIIMLLSGCGLRQTRESVVYKDKYIPIPYCPRPPDIETPSYYANTLTDEQKQQLGELTKAFVISSKESVNDSDKLRMMYDAYVKIAENSESRINAIERMGEEVDRTLLEQSYREVSHELEALSLKFEVYDEKATSDILQSLNQMDENP